MASQSVRRGGLAAMADKARTTQQVGFSTLVDIVLVIDGTGSMQNLLDAVKESALSFHDKVVAGLAERRRRVDRLRLKVIVYRDIYVDANAFEESSFFDLPEDAAAFRRFVENVKAQGGGDEPESGLEALWKAFRLPFQPNEARKKARQIICLMTDASAHPLDDPQRLTDPEYPQSAPKNLSELQDAWEGMDHTARRLLIFAPMASPWPELQNWSEVLFTPSATGMSGINADTYEGILAMIKGSI